MGDVKLNMSDETINQFAQILAGHHLTVSVRKSRGRDIRAACGQLIVEGRRRLVREISRAFPPCNHLSGTAC